MKNLKGWIIAGSVLLIVGVVVWLLGMTIIDWDFYALDNTTYTQKSYEQQPDENITAIEIDFGSGITVCRGDSVKFDYYERDKYPVDIELDGTTLKIKENRPNKIFHFGMFDLKGLRNKNVLTVPNGIELTVDSVNANIKLDGVTLKSLTVDGTNFDLWMKDCVVEGGLSVDSTNFDLEMSATTVKGNLGIKSTNFDGEIDGCVVEGAFTLHSTNCDMSVNRFIAKSAEIRSTNADIELDRLTVDDLTMHATNLDAEIEIVGDKADYTIKCNGRRLPAQQTGTTDKFINLSGTNNHVDLRFVAA